MISRRAMVAGGALAVAGSWPLSRVGSAAEKTFLPQGLPEGVYDTAMLEALPGKKPLIKLTYRPPNYETPLSHFTSEFTPNESFFVRYHLAGIPDEIDAAQWKLKVGGEGVGKPLELSLSELRSSFDAAEVAAVCQCSGNRRGLSEPHVAGVQWGLGAVGNALWKGVRLKEVLNRANLRPETAEIVVNGADGPVLDGTPDFIKSLPSTRPSMTIDAKTRSKWAKVMCWVASHDKKDESFTEFVKRHGGLNECAYSDSLDRPPRKRRR